MWGRGVADATEHDFGTEQGQETVAGDGPAVPGLGEVLKCGEDLEALAAGFGHQRREIGERGYDGRLVERVARQHASHRP